MRRHLDRDLDALLASSEGDSAVDERPLEHAVLDTIRAQYQHLPGIALWLAGELRKCGELAPMLAAMLAPGLVETVLIAADDLAPGYPWYAVEEPDYAALARDAGLSVDLAECQRLADEIDDRLADRVSLLGMWGPEAKRHVEAEAATAAEPAAETISGAQ